MLLLILKKIRKNLLTRSVVLLYTRQLAPETLIERSRDKILPRTNMKLRVQNLKSPASAARGLGLTWTVTGIFGGTSDRVLAAGTSRNL